MRWVPRWSLSTGTSGVENRQVGTVSSTTGLVGVTVTSHVAERRSLQSAVSCRVVAQTLVSVGETGDRVAHGGASTSAEGGVGVGDRSREATGGKVPDRVTTLETFCSRGGTGED